MFEKQIREFLNRLGICPSYKGYPYLVHAVYLVMTHYCYLCPVMKHLYQDIAEQFDVSPSTVQYSIRSILETHWTTQNLHRFVEITGYPADYTPTPKEFIAIAANHLRQSDETT